MLCGKKVIYCKENINSVQFELQVIWIKENDFLIITVTCCMLNLSLVSMINMEYSALLLHVVCLIICFYFWRKYVLWKLRFL